MRTAGQIDDEATSQQIGAYSSATGIHYSSWDALIEAEANGYVAVAIISNGKETWPWVLGPFPTKREAENARVRVRNKMNREKRADPMQYGNLTYKCHVRPAWKG